MYTENAVHLHYKNKPFTLYTHYNMKTETQLK